MAWRQDEDNKKKWCEKINCDDRLNLIEVASESEDNEKIDAVKEALTGDIKIPNDMINDDILDNFLMCCDAVEKNQYYDDATQESYEAEGREGTCTDIGVTCNNNMDNCGNAIGCIDSFICLDPADPDQNCPRYETEPDCGPYCTPTSSCTGRADCNYTTKDSCETNLCYWTPGEKVDPAELKKNLLAAARSEKNERNDMDDGLYA